MDQTPVTPPPGVPKGLQGKIIISFNTATGETTVSAAMDTQDMKNLSIGVLLTAINIIMHYQQSAILRPPIGANGKILPGRLPN